MKIYENLRKSTKINETLEKSTKIYENLRKSTKIYRNLCERSEQASASEASKLHPAH